MRIAIAVSQFNRKITQLLLDGALARAKEKGFADEHVEVIEVPGCVELPLIAQQFILTEEFDAVICLGAVIKGETDHYEYVCQSVTSGCQQVALKHNVPVIFGVLTTQTAELALARANGEHSNKGAECVDTAIDSVGAMHKCKTRGDSLKYA